MKKRFIKSEYLPPSLWCDNSKSIFLPQRLTELWEDLLKKNDLYDLAKEKAPEGFEGGLSKEDTDKHLAWRYNGSCARVMLSLLDPENSLDEISDVYASIFAGNDVFLADLPSGSGAALISILCTLHDLRKHNILPRYPLNISIVAGEISPTAQSYLREQLESLVPNLEEQAIWITYEILTWNALDPISTTDLIIKMTLASQNCTARLLVLSNFTGFLEGNSKWKDAKPQFDEIFRYSRGSLSTVIWIEPQRNNVPSFFSRVIKHLKGSFKRFLGSKSSKPDETWYAKANSKCKQPIKGGDFHVNLTVMRFDLPLEEQQ